MAHPPSPHTQEPPCRPRLAQLARMAMLPLAILTLGLALFFALQVALRLSGRSADAGLFIRRFVENPAASAPATELHPTADAVFIDEVPIISQNPELPNGCEASSLAIVLQHWGFDADKMDLAYNYVPREDFSLAGKENLGPHPAQAYAGDPASSFGFYCLAPPLHTAAQSYLAGQGSALTAQDISGSSETELEAWLENGCPIVFWVTLDGSAPRTAPRFYWLLPDGSQYHPYSNLHCVVLRGCDDNYFYFVDPLEGKVRMERQAAMNSYLGLGAQAVVIAPAH